MKKLTIGMSTYDDYDGVFFTIQSLRMHQIADISDDVEIIVIDNNPTSAHGIAIKNFVTGWVGGRYIPFESKKGTSVRNEIFKHATGKYTVCIDSHVLIENGGISNLLEYYNSNPDTKNLIQGPLLYDGLNKVSTHFSPEWRDTMYGVWATDQLSYDQGKPFEIPMMGLGLFSCKTSEWQWFNEKFRGFGGEEGYIHEKFRRAGGKCICLPTLKWNHRFVRVNGVPYQNILEDRIWNYFIGWLEILKDPTDAFFEQIIKEYSKILPKPAIQSIFNEAINNTSR